MSFLKQDIPRVLTTQVSTSTTQTLNQSVIIDAIQNLKEALVKIEMDDETCPTINPIHLANILISIFVLFLILIFIFVYFLPRFVNKQVNKKIEEILSGNYFEFYCNVRVVQMSKFVFNELF